MVMLGRALGIQPETNPDLSDFADGDSVPDYAKGYVAAMTKAGIVNGISAGLLGVDHDITRAATVTILDRAIAVYANEAGQTVSGTGSGIVLVVADNVTVTGEVENVIVAGAGIGSVTLQDATVSGAVTMLADADLNLAGATTAKAVQVGEDAQVTINADDTTKVENVTVTGADSTVTINGNVDTVTVADDAENATVIVAEGATVDSVVLAAADGALEVSGTVGTVSVSKKAANSTVKANSTAVIKTVESAADGVSISGDGKVETAVITGNDTTVSTANTAVQKSADATNVVVSGEGSTTTILPTESETETETNTAAGGSGSGSNTNTGSNSGSGTNTDPNAGSNSGSDSNTEPGTGSEPGSDTDPTTTTTTYTVTFDSDGGTDIDAVTVDENATVAAPADPTREGDTFNGWYTVDGELYDFTTPVTADITLTAKWTVLHAHDWSGDECTACGETKDKAMKFSLSVASDSAVTATVYDDYSMVVQLPAAGSTVSTSGVSIEVAMQNVASLDVSGKKSGSVDFSFDDLGDNDVPLDSYLKNCYGFGSAAVKVTIGKQVCTYNFQGSASDNTIVATPENIAATRSAWQELTSHIDTGKGSGSDIVIGNGSSLQIGDEKLVFESNYTDDLSLAACAKGDLNESIRAAVKLEDPEKVDAIQSQVKAVLTNGTSLAVNNSVATLNGNATITIKGISLDTPAAGSGTLATILSTLKEDETSVAVVKDLIQAFDAFVGAVSSASGTVEVKIAF
jgi:uncharacterized repeat protein (TIGR02543 family)